MSEKMLKHFLNKVEINNSTGHSWVSIIWYNIDTK